MTERPIVLCASCGSDHHELCSGRTWTTNEVCACDNVTHGRRWVVYDKFFITDRGPVITRPDEVSRAARDAGQMFLLGEVVWCRRPGERALSALVVGIESWAIFEAPQGGLMLRGVTLDELAVGQVWV